MNQIAKFFILFTFIQSLGAMVVELTDSDFDDFIRDHPTTLVKFTVTWCIHCQKLKPEFDDVATKLETKFEIDFANVDCEKGGYEICSRYGVASYPTIFLIQNEKYQGERTSTGLIDYILKDQ